MGQKVNPHGLRVGVIKDWDSRWYAREDKVGDLIVEDYNIRKYLKSTLYAAGIAKIEIERDNAKVKINIHCSRPGVIIGKGGTEIEALRQKVEAKLGKTVALNIVEVRSPDMNAQLVAENIAAQLEKRISFRRAMKQAISSGALAITGRASIASSPLATSFTVTIFVMQSTSGCVCCTCAKICAKGARSAIERNVCAMGRPPSL